MTANMKNRIVNVNGRITDEAEARISPLDRGYLYGDSLYEVVRTYSRKLLALDEHLERLKASAHLARMDLQSRMPQFRSAILDTVEAFKQRFPKDEVYIRFMVSRGRGDILFSEKGIREWFPYVVVAETLPTFDESAVRKGIRIKIAKRIRNHPNALDPAMKSGNYLNSVLAFFEAESDGYDDAIMLNHEGFVTEGTTFNIWYVRDGIVVTPPLSVGILDGITRRHTLRIARDKGLTTRESLFMPEHLYQAQEVFLTSSVKDVFPIVAVDQTAIHQGTPGPVTLELRQEFQAWARSQ